MKAECIKGTRSSDGTILVKDNNDAVHHIKSLNDLEPLGYSPSLDKWKVPKSDPAPPVRLSGVGISAPGGAMAMHSD